MLLSRQEVQELTGFARPKRQAAWLEENGIPFRVGGDGYPKVLCVAVEGVLSVAPKRRRTEPNLAVLAQIGKGR